MRKKAALCLLRLYRKNPDVVNVDGWYVRILLSSLHDVLHYFFLPCLFDWSIFFPFRADRMAQLLDERDLGVLTSSMSLLVALVSNHHDSYWSCLPKCVKILERLARNQDIPQEYTYYGIPSPWLQVCNMYISFCFIRQTSLYVPDTK